jgi:hypothetical protein
LGPGQHGIGAIVGNLGDDRTDSTQNSRLIQIGFAISIFHKNLQFLSSSGLQSRSKFPYQETV